MMFRGSKLARSNEQGFTLVELLVAIAIAAVITGGITYAIMQLLTVNSRDSNHMIAVRQVQQAGKEVSKDTLQAQNVTPGVSQGFPLALAWQEWGTNQTHAVNYTLAAGPGGVVQLWRSQSVTGENSTSSAVAEYIDIGQTSCVWNNITRVLTFTVTATLGTASETRVYQVEPRPSGPD